jgi:hypothetical protein
MNFYYISMLGDAFFFALRRLRMREKILIPVDFS